MAYSYRSQPTTAAVKTMSARPAPGANGARPAPATNSSRPPNIQVAQAYHTFDDPALHAAANTFPLPPSTTTRVVSNAGAGAVATRVYVFNNDVANNITNNGSGVASITYVYQDGFTGTVTSQLFGLTRAGVGAICYGMAVRINITATGAGNPAALATMSPGFFQYNAYGFPIPLNINPTADQTRDDFDTSIEVMPVVVNFSRFTQASIIAEVANTHTITLYFTPNFKR